MDVRAVFRARRGCGGVWPGCLISSRPEIPPNGGLSSPRRSRPSSRLVGLSRIMSGRAVGHDGAAARLRPRGSGVDRPAAHHSGGGPENPGSEGQRPPQPTQATRSVAPRKSRCRSITRLEPAPKEVISLCSENRTFYSLPTRGVGLDSTRFHAYDVGERIILNGYPMCG